MKGGAKNVLPDLIAGSATGEELSNKLAIYYVSGHGTIQDDARLFIIPPHTYILPTCAGGYITPKALGPIAINLIQMEGMDWWQEFLDRIRADEFPINPCAKSFMENVAEVVNAGNESMCSKTSSQAIYEPGDLMVDIDLELYDFNKKPMLAGLWQVPIDVKHIESVMSESEKSAWGTRIVSSDERRRYLSKDGDLFGSWVLEHYGEEGVPALLETNESITLFDLLKSPLLPKGTADKPCLIVLDVCRANTSDVKGHIRRMSISARSREDSRAVLNIDFLAALVDRILSTVPVDKKLYAHAKAVDEELETGTVKYSELGKMLFGAQKYPTTKDLFEGRKLIGGKRKTQKMKHTLKKYKKHTRRKNVKTF